MTRPSRRAPRTSAALIALALSVASLAACSTAAPSAEGGTTADASGSYPVTIEHVYGDTTIEEKPERIVTLGWYSQDVVAALGEVPVGVEDFTWGNVDTYLPWFKDRVEELDGELPEIIEFTDAGEYDFEQILALAPDVILANHSGITENDYKRLTEIAPTIGYAESKWASDREDLTLAIGTVLDKEDEAEALLEEADAAVEAAADAHPEFEDVVFSYGWFLGQGETSLGLYLPRDPRVPLIEELGFTVSPDIAALESTTDEFFASVSLEELGDIESQFHIGWVNSAEDVANTVDDPLVARWTPIAGSSYYFVDDQRLAWATTAPSVLSIPSTIDDLADALSGALASAN
ncbi:ABC transporter substrate-binding protein [Microbacterium sp. SD291]|uniref:ABC transporter substrate-binding protein n=1 Tax=Microbacterium sp. SD291 TaxID=2782007 RepID=UPI001A96E7AA|nr:ABC transporter substrate-binding protein [Microbacterium sp. SD291]MBO0979517.1 ABC transporter substrate-binding protein [Microbacterium sp. SD291]